MYFLTHVLSICHTIRMPFICSKSRGMRERNANDKVANEHQKMSEKKDCIGFILCFWSPFTEHVNDTSVHFCLCDFCVNIFSANWLKLWSVWSMWSVIQHQRSLFCSRPKTEICCLAKESYGHDVSGDLTCNSFNWTWHKQNSSNQLVYGIFQTLSLQCD